MITNDQILEIAKQAGADEYAGRCESLSYELIYEELIAFARLIEDQVREEDAALVEDNAGYCNEGSVLFDTLMSNAAAIRRMGK